MRFDETKPPFGEPNPKKNSSKKTLLAIILVIEAIVIHLISNRQRQRAESSFNQAAQDNSADTNSTSLSSPTPPNSNATPGYPESHYNAISGHKQAYALSCEASAAVDWAAYFAVDIYESDFQFALPISDNPDYGFCGEVLTDGWGQIPPYAYGVHAGPVADLLVKYGLPAQTISGWTLEEVKHKLAEDKPILIWVIGNMEYSEPTLYVDTAGREVWVAPFEHSVILTGYDVTTVKYMNNGRFFDVPAEVFLTSWGVLSNMGIVHE